MVLLTERLIPLTIWITKRVGRAIILLFLVVVITFELLHLAPGGPAEALAGEEGASSPQIIAAINKEYGLNKPLIVQFWTYLIHLIHGNLGQSYFYHESVTDLIAQRLPNTVLLASLAFVLALIIGTVIGILSGYYRDSNWSMSINMIALIGYSIPVFWLGLELIIIFGSIFPVLPSSGMHAAIPQTGWANVEDVSLHLILPVLTLSIVYLAAYSLTARRGIIEAMSADYVRTARAKGISEKNVLLKHAFRNALLPLLSLAGVQAAGIVSGATLVESVFGWPGVGLLAVHSVERRDTPVLLGIFIVSAVFVVTANVVTDILYGFVDPRVRSKSQ